jgi:hypothetical protein
MPNETTHAEIQKSLQHLVEAVESQGQGDELVVTLLREMADLIKQRQPRGGGLTEEQAAFLIESGTFTAESLAATEASVARGDLAELERKTRLEAITGSLSAAEAAEKLGIEASRLRNRQAEGSLYSFIAGGKRRYPTWQFTDDPAQPVLQGLTTLIKAFPDDMHPASIQNFMATRQENLLVNGDRMTPVEWLLHSGDPQALVDILDSFLQS